MSLCFYALVMNPGDAAPSVRVLRGLSSRSCKSEVRRLYLKTGGDASIHDGNPLNPLHNSKQIGDAFSL